MSKIGTNQMAVNAQKAMSQIQRKMTKTMEKLSTGLRINKPNDDPAGLSISTTMTSQITGYNAAAKNINDAIAMVQTIDGALGEQISLMQRMRELAVQSTTETYTNADRTMMDTEFDNLKAEIIRISPGTLPPPVSGNPPATRAGCRGPSPTIPKSSGGQPRAPVNGDAVRGQERPQQSCMAEHLW